jgi:energy-coupling factor transporter ATP-binding protein EcfA2
VIKLKRLKINRYRNVEPCDLVFGDRFNILLGPNGAGKTTLLNLISKVLRTNLTDTSDAFSIEIELSFPKGTVSGTIESFDNATVNPDDLLPKVQKGRLRPTQIGHAAPVPRFELRVSYDALSTIAFKRDAKSLTMTVDGIPQARDYLVLRQFEFSSLLERVDLLASMESDRPSSEIHPATLHAARFDESLDMFRSITARLDNSTTSDLDLRPRILCEEYPQTVLGTVQRGVILSEGLIPEGFLRSLDRTSNDESTDISFNETNLAFLSDTCRLLGLREASAKFELTEKSVNANPGDDTYEYGNLKFWFTRKDGSIFQDQHLSYGQKRLLTFLYYLECNPSIVIADELVNGLHHAWIKECMEAIGERQAFLTSQNPLLLDYLFFTSVQEVKESFILCRTEAVGNSEKMIWRNLTDDEAAMFYSAYKVGIEHVGEILRTRGLW